MRNLLITKMPNYTVGQETHDIVFKSKNIPCKELPHCFIS